MSEIALSPGSSAAPPLATEDKPDVDATVAPSVLGPEADQAAPLEPSASTITPAKKSKPKKKSTAQARASEVVKDETSSQAGDANMGSPAPSAVGAESALGQSGIGLGIADGAVEAVPQPGGIEGEGQAPAGPSALPASVKKPTKAAPKRSAPKKNTEGHHLLQYTNTFVPPLVNIKNPAGEYAQKESNIDVIRQNSQAKARLEKETVAAERAAVAAAEGGEPATLVNPLDNIIIIHLGSRSLRIARASQYSPCVVPNCIARPSNTVNWGTEPPVPGSRVKRLAAKAEQERHNKKRRKDNGETHELKDGDVDMDGAGAQAGLQNGTSEHAGSRPDEEELVGEDWQNPVDASITALREYLKEHLRLRRLSTNFDEVRRIRAANSRIKPENIPDLNDPHRIEWTDVNGQKYFVGVDALRLPPSKGFSVRYPILNRQLNTRDWQSSQLLMDDIGLIISYALRKELGIDPKDLSKFSVVLVVPDHGDRFYIQEMTSLLLGSMGFKEIAIHQGEFDRFKESYAAIFCAGMSSSCVVDVGANRTSITCVDEGLVVQDSRVVLNYGGDDVTVALAHLLERAAFPYKELDLARAQDWLMMDALKMRICTLEEHLVANTAWEVFAVREVQPTQKYPFRTFDENVLAPLTWFDTSMIDFAEKKGRGRFRIRGRNKGVSDALQSSYDEITAAMNACTRHLWQPKQRTTASIEDIKAEGGSKLESAILPDAADDVSAQFGDPAPETIGSDGLNGEGSSKPPRIVEIPSTEPGTAAPSVNGTPAPEDVLAGAPGDADTTPTLGGDGDNLSGTVPTVPQPAAPGIEYVMPPGFDVFKQSSQSALDGAIAASISQAGSENRIKAAAGNILLIGGASALKGLPGILQDRLPHLIREATGVNLDHVSIVPPPRGLDPAFVSWKGASVMCNLEALSDMWIRRDEWEALGARAIKDRCLFL